MGQKEDEEALRKMLDDLGIHRVEELPMADDIGGGSARYPNNQGAPPPVAQKPQRVLTGQYASIWQAAIDGNTFKDRDYEDVKDLDDLGDESGRLYANRPRGGYGDMPTHPEIHGPVARRYRALGGEMPPSAHLHPNPKKLQVSKLGIVLNGDAPITAFNNHKGTKAIQMNIGTPPRPQGGSSAVAAREPRPQVQQGGSRPAPINGSNLRPQQGASHLTAPSLDRPLQPQSATQPQGNGPNGAPSSPNILVSNSHNIVFEAPIQYVARRRGGKETPGKVTLQQPPKKGIFRLFVMDKLYAEHRIGDFQNYTHNHEEARISVRFNHPSDSNHTAKEKGGKKVGGEGEAEHTLKFQTGDAAFDFLETFNLLWAGMIVNPIPVKKPAQATNQPGRATQNGPAPSVARRPALAHSPHPARNGPAPPATRNGAPPQVTRNGPATPATRNGAPPHLDRSGPPPQGAHWGARLAAATDFDPFSVTIGSPRPQQAQPPAPTATTSKPPQANLRPPPSLPAPRVLAPAPGLPVPASGSRVPPGFAQPQSKLLASPAGGSSQQPNLAQPPKAASKPEPCNPPAETMGQSNAVDIGKTNQIKPDSAKSNDIQPETKNPTADASAPKPEDILKALATIAGITETGAKEPVDMAPVQALAKLLVSLIPGKLDNLLSGSVGTSHTEDTGKPSQKKETAQSSSDPRERGESSGDSCMLVDAAETSESAIPRKGRGTRTDSKPSAAKHGTGSSRLERLQYSENELRAFRHNAVPPPHWLNELRFLPARGENVHRTPAPAPRPMPSLGEQFAKIQASAYEVGLGNKAESPIKAGLNNPNESVADTVGEAAARTSVNEPDKAASDTGAQGDSGKVGVENAKIVSNPALDNEDNQQAGTPQARSAGLQASVWAAGEARVEHPHAFAGGIAEYPQNSYFNDLLLLVDDPVINTASSNLGGEAMPEAQEVQEQLEAPRILGLGASRHAGPSTPTPRGDKSPHYPPNRRF